MYLPAKLFSIGNDSIIGISIVSTIVSSIGISSSTGSISASISINSITGAGTGAVLAVISAVILSATLVCVLLLESTMTDFDLSIVVRLAGLVRWFKQCR